MPIKRISRVSIKPAKRAPPAPASDDCLEKFLADLPVGSKITRQDFVAKWVIPSHAKRYVFRRKWPTLVHVTAVETDNVHLRITGALIYFVSDAPSVGMWKKVLLRGKKDYWSRILMHFVVASQM